MKFSISIIVFFSILSASCVKDKPNPPHYTTPNDSGRKVLIVNEGAYGNGNASLSVYNIDKDSVYNNVFQQENGVSLGDVFQSIIEVDSILFLSINNSDKIKIIRKDNYAFVKDISIPKPRYMLRVGEHKLYVSSLYHPYIYIVDLQQMMITDSILLDYPNTEGMLLMNDKVYACNWNKQCNYVYKINTENDSIESRIMLAGYAPKQLVADKNNHLWVIAGNIQEHKTTTITLIEPVSGTIVSSFQFNATTEIIKPVMNPTKDTLYYIAVKYDGSADDNGIYRMSINDVNSPTQAFIQALPLQYYYGLAIDNITGNIYVSNPKGFIQSSQVSIYKPNGNLLHQFTTSIGTANFLFE